MDSRTILLAIALVVFCPAFFTLGHLYGRNSKTKKATRRARARLTKTISMLHASIGTLERINTKIHQSVEILEQLNRLLEIEIEIQKQDRKLEAIMKDFRKYREQTESLSVEILEFDVYRHGAAEDSAKVSDILSRYETLTNWGQGVDRACSVSIDEMHRLLDEKRQTLTAYETLLDKYQEGLEEILGQ